MSRPFNYAGLGALTATTVWLAAWPVNAADLVGAVDQTLGAPLITRGQGRAEGLLVEIYASLAHEVGRNLHLLNLPRKRLTESILSSQVDVLCHASKAWIDSNDPALVWSGPLYKQHDLLLRSSVGPSGERDPGRITGTVTTALGYVYPGLDAGFVDGRLKRMDVPTDRQIIDLVAAGRSDFGIVSSFIWAAQRKANPAIESKVKVVYRFKPVDVECAYSKSSAAAQALEKAFAKLRIDGSVAAIAQSYGALR